MDGITTALTTLREGFDNPSLTNLLAVLVLTIMVSIWLLFRRNYRFLLKITPYSASDETNALSISLVTRSSMDRWRLLILNLMNKSLGRSIISGKAYLWSYRLCVAASTTISSVAWIVSGNRLFIGQIGSEISPVHRLFLLFLWVLLIIFTLETFEGGRGRKLKNLAIVISLPFMSFTVGVSPQITILIGMSAFGVCFFVGDGRAVFPLFVSGLVFTAATLLLPHRAEVSKELLAFIPVALTFGTLSLIFLRLRHAFTKKGLLGAIVSSYVGVMIAAAAVCAWFIQDIEQFGLIRYIFVYFITTPVVCSVFLWSAVIVARLTFNAINLHGSIIKPALLNCGVGLGLMYACAASLGITLALLQLSARVSNSDGRVLDFGGRVISPGSNIPGSSIIFAMILSVVFVPALVYLFIGTGEILTINLPKAVLEWHSRGLASNLSERPRKMFHHACVMTAISFVSGILVVFWLSLLLFAVWLLQGMAPELANPVFLVMSKFVPQGS